MHQFFVLLFAPSAVSSIGKALTSSIIALSLLGTEPILPNVGSASQDSVQRDQRQQYDSYSSSYDKLNGGSVTSALGIDEMRRQAATYVYGDMLEIAVGTGLQSQYYDWKNLKSFTGVDMSQGMLAEARNRILLLTASSNPEIPVTLNAMDVEKLAFSNNQVFC